QDNQRHQRLNSFALGCGLVLLVAKGQGPQAELFIIPAMKRTLLIVFIAVLSLVAGAQTSKPKARATAFPGPNVYPMQEGFVDANGVLIYYKIIGRGAPLMVVHGGPGASHDYLLPGLLPLARTSKVIFIDERGSGRSERLEDASQYTVENMAEDDGAG